jgi:hypothetical protein
MFCFIAWLVLLGSISFGDKKDGDRAKEAEETVRALRNARDCLESIHSASGGYPSSGGEWVAIDLRELEACSQIPERLMDLLGQSPRWTGTPERTVLYRSDSNDFKLLAHKMNNCIETRKLSHSLIDPVRTRYSRQMIPGGWKAASKDEFTVAQARHPMIKPDPALQNPLFADCWAFGFWSSGGVLW